VRFISVILVSHWFRRHSWTFTYSRLIKPVPDDSARVVGVAFPNGHRYLQRVGQLDALFTDITLSVLFPSHRLLAYPSAYGTRHDLVIRGTILSSAERSCGQKSDV
jgi:hypothetical protein